MLYYLNKLLWRIKISFNYRNYLKSIYILFVYY